MADNAHAYSISPLLWAYDNPEKKQCFLAYKGGKEFWPVSGKKETP